MNQEAIDIFDATRSGGYYMKIGWNQKPPFAHATVLGKYNMFSNPTFY